MPRIGVSITKSTTFRGGNQEFSNVYYYEMLAFPSVAEAETLIDNLVFTEKRLHSSVVTFVIARVWKQIGTKAENEMITQKLLSGAGLNGTVTNFDRERAFLFRLRAGVDTRGNPVYLRKWFHACGKLTDTVLVGAGNLENTTSFSGADRTAMVDAMDAIGDANGSAGAPKLCAKGGRLPTPGETWSAHQFLEHRQLGDMWRG
jgi:hypothetical protein